MNNADFSGFSAGLPRVFSIPLFGLGVILLSYGLGSPIADGEYPPPDEALVMGLGMVVFGFHGIVTNTQKVGIIRRIFSYFAGAAGGMVGWNIAVMLGLI